jgi:FMN phosphatase YigB (HAD superfamily)
MIKAIAFDLMGVIFKEAHIVRNILYPMLADKYQYDFVKDKYIKYNKGEISNKEFWKFFFLDDFQKAKKFEKKYLDAFKLDDNFFEIIDYLKVNYSLGVISNLPKEWGDYLIYKHNLTRFFNPIIISGVYNIMKPDLAIFNLFVKLSKYTFSETLFIDDKISALLAAKKLGMNTVLLNKEISDLSEIEKKESIDYFIKEFNGLKKIL